MTLNESIKTFSIEIEKELSDLWDILIKFKNASNNVGTNLDPDEIVYFQYSLARVLNKLTQKYHPLSYSKKRLLKQRQKMVYKKWIYQKKELQKLLDLLNFLMVVTKSIGDAFVFIFYNFDREYLNKHLEAPPQQLTLPSGVGGMGEIEFVKKFKILNGQMVLYHGITNILRIGDFTLFNMQDNKVAAVGELKSGLLEDNILNLNLTIIGHKSRHIKFDIPAKILESQDDAFLLPNRERYMKQVKTMVDSFKYLDHKVSIEENKESKKFFSKPKFDIMAELANVSNIKSIAYEEVAHGLILGRVINRGATMFDRFMTQINDFDIEKQVVIDEMKPYVYNILKHDLENSLAIGHIHFNNKLRIEPQVGAKPIFWYPINLETLKKIYFGEIVFFTIYNVGFLIKALKVKGYSYEYNERYKTKGFIQKKAEVHCFVTGVNFFVKMITDYLQDESVVIEVIDSVSTSMQSKFKTTGLYGKASMNILLE